MSYALNVKTLYEGCYLASIACAVMSAKFPELSFEHSMVLAVEELLRFKMMFVYVLFGLIIVNV